MAWCADNRTAIRYASISAALGAAIGILVFLGSNDSSIGHNSAKFVAAIPRVPISRPMLHPSSLSGFAEAASGSIRSSKFDTGPTIVSDGTSGVNSPTIVQSSLNMQSATDDQVLSSTGFRQGASSFCWLAGFILAASIGVVAVRQYFGHGQRRSESTLSFQMPVVPQRAGLAMASTVAPVAVIGATGKVGRLAVKELVDQGYLARVLLRHEPAGEPSSADDAEPAAVAAWLATMPGVEFVKGDVTDRDSVFSLLRGCQACLAMHGARRMSKLSDLWTDSENTDPKHSKNVNYEGVRNIIEAAKASGTCRRVVRITGKGETPWQLPSILINGLGSMAKAWNYEGEQLLRGCADVDYTIVRPGVMRPDDKPSTASLALADNGGDLKVSSIPHGEIASLCVQSLAHPNAAKATLTAMRVAQGEGAGEWKPLLQTVQPDTRKFRDDLLKEHRRAVRYGGAALAVLAAAIITGIGFALRAIVLALLGLVGW